MDSRVCDHLQESTVPSQSIDLTHLQEVVVDLSVSNFKEEYFSARKSSFRDSYQEYKAMRIHQKRVENILSKETTCSNVYTTSRAGVDFGVSDRDKSLAVTTITEHHAFIRRSSPDIEPIGDASRKPSPDANSSQLHSSPQIDSPPAKAYCAAFSNPSTADELDDQVAKPCFLNISTHPIFLSATATSAAKDVFIGGDIFSTMTLAAEMAAPKPDLTDEYADVEARESDENLCGIICGAEARHRSTPVSPAPVASCGLPAGRVGISDAFEQQKLANSPDIADTRAEVTPPRSEYFGAHHDYGATIPTSFAFESMEASQAGADAEMNSWASSLLQQHFEGMILLARQHQMARETACGAAATPGSASAACDTQGEALVALSDDVKHCLTQHPGSSDFELSCEDGMILANTFDEQLLLSCSDLGVQDRDDPDGPVIGRPDASDSIVGIVRAVGTDKSSDGIFPKSYCHFKEWLGRTDTSTAVASLIPSMSLFRSPTTAVSGLDEQNCESSPSRTRTHDHICRGNHLNTTGSLVTESFSVEMSAAAKTVAVVHPLLVELPATYEEFKQRIAGAFGPSAGLVGLNEVVYSSTVPQLHKGGGQCTGTERNFVMKSNHVNRPEASMAEKSPDPDLSSRALTTGRFKSSSDEDLETAINQSLTFPVQLGNSCSSTASANTPVIAGSFSPNDSEFSSVVASAERHRRRKKAFIIISPPSYLDTGPIASSGRNVDSLFSTTSANISPVPPAQMPLNLSLDPPEPVIARADPHATPRHVLGAQFSFSAQIRSPSLVLLTPLPVLSGNVVTALSALIRGYRVRRMLRCSRVALVVDLIRETAPLVFELRYGNSGEARYPIDEKRAAAAALTKAERRLGETLRFQLRAQQNELRRLLWPAVFSSQGHFSGNAEKTRSFNRSKFVLPANQPFKHGFCDPQQSASMEKSASPILFFGSGAESEQTGCNGSQPRNFAGEGTPGSNKEPLKLFSDLIVDGNTLLNEIKHDRGLAHKGKLWRPYRRGRSLKQHDTLSVHPSATCIAAADDFFSPADSIANTDSGKKPDSAKERGWLRLRQTRNISSQLVQMSLSNLNTLGEIAPTPQSESAASGMTVHCCSSNAVFHGSGGARARSQGEILFGNVASYRSKRMVLQRLNQFQGMNANRGEEPPEIFTATVSGDSKPKFDHCPEERIDFEQGGGPMIEIQAAESHGRLRIFSPPAEKLLFKPQASEKCARPEKNPFVFLKRFLPVDFHTARKNSSSTFFYSTTKCAATYFNPHFSRKGRSFRTFQTPDWSRVRPRIDSGRPVTARAENRRPQPLQPEGFFDARGDGADQRRSILHSPPFL